MRAFASKLKLANKQISPQDLFVCNCSNETKYSIFGRESRIAELAIIDSIYTLIALNYDNSAFLEVEKALKNHKY